jgi:hypothetical protein
MASRQTTSSLRRQDASRRSKWSAGRACSPAKVLGTNGTAGCRHPSAASREVRCSPECCERPARGSLVPRSRRVPRRFRRAPRGFYRPPSPADLRRRVHPLVSVTPLQRLRLVPAPCLPARSAFRGSPSLFATSTGGSVTTGPIPPRSVLGVSHALDGLLHHRPCRFVSPCSHVQGSPSRGSSRTAGPARRRPVPSRRWRRSAAPVARRSTSPRPALRAFIRARAPVPDRGV